MDPARGALLEEIWQRVDPRLLPALRLTFDQPPLPLSLGGRSVVLVGQRAAGKSWLLPLLARWLDRPGHDLDAAIAADHQRPIAPWVEADEAGFRRAERATFAALPKGTVIAAGGGFLSLHGDLLQGTVPVLVPVTFETYRARLIADRQRPRLRPELPGEEELAQVFVEREARHARVTTVPLASFLRSTAKGF